MKFLDYALSLNPSVLSMPIFGDLATRDGYDRSVTVSGSPTFQKNSRKGFGFLSNTSGAAYSIADGAEQDFTDQTIFVYFTKPIKHSDNSQTIASKWDGTGLNWLIQILSSDLLYIYNNTSASQNTTSSVLGVDSICIRTTSSTDTDFFYNGVVEEENGGLDFSTQPNSDVYLGDRYLLDRPTLTPIGVVAVFPSALDDSEILNLHNYMENFIIGYQPTNQIINSSIRTSSRFKYPVTLSAVTAPSNVGCFNTWAGSHEWVDDGNDRYIMHDSTDRRYYASIPSNYAYGAWYGKYIAGIGGSFNGALFTLSTKPDEIFNASGQTGYMLYQQATERFEIYTQDGGTVTKISESSQGWLPVGGEIVEWFMTRNRVDGQFTLWSRESIHPTWTQALQVTNNLFTTTNFIQNYSNTTGYDFGVYPYIIFPNGDTLEPNDIPFLAD